LHLWVKGKKIGEVSPNISFLYKCYIVKINVKISRQKPKEQKFSKVHMKVS